jgi:sporulation protein YlmC with PRC-barrel domain
VELLNEGETFSLHDLIRREVRDSEDREIGHLEDLAMDMAGSRPVASDIAVHLQWIDCIGDLVLPRPVEDIVLLFPWSEVASLQPEVVRLRKPHPNFEVTSSEGKILLRRDVLNKQITDEEGNRLQRADDVILRQEGVLLFLEGLQVGMDWFPAGKRMQKVVGRLRRLYNRPGEANIIPYEAILRVDEEALIIRT